MLLTVLQAPDETQDHDDDAPSSNFGGRVNRAAPAASRRCVASSLSYLPASEMTGFLSTAICRRISLFIPCLPHPFLSPVHDRDDHDDDDGPGDSQFGGRAVKPPSFGGRNARDDDDDDAPGDSQFGGRVSKPAAKGGRNAQEDDDAPGDFGGRVNKPPARGARSSQDDDDHHDDDGDGPSGDFGGRVSKPAKYAFCDRLSYCVVRPCMHACVCVCM
jgi:hypothetical protein